MEEAARCKESGAQINIERNLTFTFFDASLQERIKSRHFDFDFDFDQDFTCTGCSCLAGELLSLIGTARRDIQQRTVKYLTDVTY